MLYINLFYFLINFAFFSLYFLYVLLFTIKFLSGFTDAEGCFNVNIVSRSASVVGFRTTLRFILDQQFEKEVLLLIATLLGTGHVSCRVSTNEVNRVAVDSFKYLPSLISYFNQFPLKSHKKPSFGGLVYNSFHRP